MGLSLSCVSLGFSPSANLWGWENGLARGQKCVTFGPGNRKNKIITNFIIWMMNVKRMGSKTMLRGRLVFKFEFGANCVKNVVRWIWPEMAKSQYLKVQIFEGYKNCWKLTKSVSTSQQILKKFFDTVIYQKYLHNSKNSNGLTNNFLIIKFF